MKNESRPDLHDLLEVFGAFKKNIMRSLCVAAVAKTESVTDGVAECSLLNAKSARIKCVPLSGLTVQANDIVLVVFTDTDYRVNLRKVKQGIQTQDIPDAKTRHSLNFGIIVGLVFRPGG